MKETGKFVLADDLGQVLAETSIPADILIEGDHLSIKEIPLNLRVIREGRATQYICVYPNGESAKGNVRKKPPGNVLCDLLLEQVDLKQGQEITGRYSVTTVKD